MPTLTMVHPVIISPGAKSGRLSIVNSSASPANTAILGMIFKNVIKQRLDIESIDVSLIIEQDNGRATSEVLGVLVSMEGGELVFQDGYRVEVTHVVALTM